MVMMAFLFTPAGPKLLTILFYFFLLNLSSRNHMKVFRPPYVDAFRPEIPGMRRVPETPDDEPRVNGLVDVFWAWRDGGAGGVNRDNRPPEPEQDPDHIRDLRLRSLRRHERDLQQHQRRQESQRQRRLERRVQRQPRQPAHRHHQMRSHR